MKNYSPIFFIPTPKNMLVFYDQLNPIRFFYVAPLSGPHPNKYRLQDAVFPVFNLAGPSFLTSQVINLSVSVKMPKRDNSSQHNDELTRRWSNIESNVSQVGKGLQKLENSSNMDQFIQEMNNMLKTVQQIKSDADTCIQLSQQTTTKRQKVVGAVDPNRPHSKFAATGVAGIPVAAGAGSVGFNQPIHIQGIQAGVVGQRPPSATFLPPQHIQQKLFQFGQPILQNAQGVPTTYPTMILPSRPPNSLSSLPPSRPSSQPQAIPPQHTPIDLSYRPITGPPGGVPPRPAGGGLPSQPQPHPQIHPSQHRQSQPQNIIQNVQQKPGDCQQLRVVLSTPSRPPSLGVVPQHRGVHLPQPRPVLKNVPQSLPTALSMQGQLLQQQQQKGGNLTLQQQLANMAAPNSHLPILPQRPRDQGGNAMAPPTIVFSKDQGGKVPAMAPVILSSKDIQGGTSIVQGGMSSKEQRGQLMGQPLILQSVPVNAQQVQGQQNQVQINNVNVQTVQNVQNKSNVAQNDKNDTIKQ